jgi:hypothetical protein
LDWEAALAVVRETYSAGAYQMRDVLYRTFILPESIASQILSNPDEYPRGLWEEAVDTAAAKSRRLVRAVGKVAKTERWFS